LVDFASNKTSHSPDFSKAAFIPEQKSE